MSTRSSPTLTFVPGTEIGFTSTGITSFRDLDPTAVVRELLQNSLDAIEGTQESTCAVAFKLRTVPISDVPGLDNYREALRLAVENRSGGKDLSDQEKIIVQCMDSVLSRDEVDVLVVSDNGTGLNRQSMHALLADGKSVKPSKSGGAFGNGHMAVIPASDLRYVLYGGRGKDGDICSGQAVLASHYRLGEEHPRPGGNGYLISGYGCVDEENAYEFGEGHRVPSLIRQELERLDSESGSVVIIPAFNNFRIPESTSALRDHIARAAACNYFPAIADKRMNITLSDERSTAARGNSLCLDHTNVQQVLSEFVGEKRSKFISGQQANESFDTVKSGKRISLQINGEIVDVYLRTPLESGNTRVDLFRNGMWITHSRRPSGGIPRVHYSRFGGYQSFHAVILLKSGDAPELHRLVRLAEGPLHNELTPKIMDDHDQAALLSTFSDIEAWLKKVVPEQSLETFRPNGFLVVSTGTGRRGSDPVSGIPHSGALVSAPPRWYDAWGTKGSGLGKGGGSSSASRAKHRNGPSTSRSVPSYFRVVAVPVGKDSKRKLHIQSNRTVNDVEVRLKLDENEDETCVPVWNDRAVEISQARISGKVARKSAYVKNQSGRTEALRLDKIAKGTVVELELTYVLPDDVKRRWPSGHSPSFRVELSKSNARSARRSPLSGDS